MRTIVFDLDGTLADTAEDLLAAANAVFADKGWDLRLGAGDRGVALQGGRAMLRLGYQRQGLEAAAVSEAEYGALLAHYAEGLDRQTRLFPGVVAALETLRGAGYRTAICTNKPEDLARELVTRLGIAPLFDALVGAGRLAVRKPDPAPYRLAVAEAGGQLARSLLVGDTETDWATAQAAGVPAVLVRFGPEGEGIARLSPDALLDHYAALPQLAARLLGTPAA